MRRCSLKWSEHIANANSSRRLLLPIDSAARARYAGFKWLVTAPSAGCAIRSAQSLPPVLCVPKMPVRVRPNSVAHQDANHIPVMRIEQ